MRPHLLTVILLSACASAEDGGGDDIATVNGPDNVIMDDTSAGVSVQILGGSASTWLFGAIEPRVDIYEEGCRDADDICHTLDADGGTIAWASTCSSNGDGSTCISQLYWRQGEMSFVIMPASGAGCWAWGDDADSYYEGCTITGWSADSY